MRVLYINVEEKIAGGEKSLLLSLESLKKRCKMLLVCPYGQLSRAAVSMGISWKKLPGAPRSRWFSPAGFFYIFKLSIFLLCVIFAKKPDIVHANNILAGFTCWLPCALTKAKLVLHVRDVPRYKLIYRIVGQRAAGVIAVSKFIRSSLLELGIPFEKISLISNPAGLFPEQINVTTKDKKNNHYVYANVGQLIPWKRQEIFIEAAKIAAKMQPDSYFWIVGDDIFKRNSSYRNDILKRIKSSGLEKRLIFKGWQNHMSDLWNQIDCLVHTACKEPFGRVVIEAMQAGVPVIASNSGGPAEFLKNGVTGHLAANDEPEVFASAMLEVAKNKKRTIEIADNAKRYVNQKFSRRAVSNSIFSFYKRVLSK